MQTIYDLFDSLTINPSIVDQLLNEAVILTKPSNPTTTMKTNTLTFPTITRVIYNLKTTESKAVRDESGKLVIDEATDKPKREITTLTNPVLATTVYFDDNTKVSVKNTLTDPVQTEIVYIDPATGATLTDSTKLDPSISYSKVVVATESAKERGLVYAIVKRLLGTIDDDGIVRGDGFGRKLRDIVTSAADQELDAAVLKVKQKISAAAHKAKQTTAAPKGPNPSLAATVRQLAETVEALSKKVNG
jgi:hypothetical protein